MKRFITIFALVISSALLLTPINASALNNTNPIGEAMLTKVVITSVTQSSTNPGDVIKVAVSFQNLNSTNMDGIMVSVNNGTSQTLSLTNNFGPFRIDLNPYDNTSPVTVTGSNNTQTNAANNIKSIGFDLVAAKNIQSGNYPLSLTLTYVDINGFTVSAERSISIRVEAAPVPSKVTPVVIISSYSLGKDKINAGDTFPLTFTLQNTSPTEPIAQMLLSMTSDSNAFTPMAGVPNQIYIGDIPAGGNYTVKINLMASNTIPSGTYNLKVEMSYQNANEQPSGATTFSANGANSNIISSAASISIPLKAPTTVPQTVEIVTPQVLVTSYKIASEHILGGSEFEMSFTLKNTSTSVANNVLFSFSSESNAFIPVSGMPNQVYVGKIAAGDVYSGKINLKANDTLASGIYALHLNVQYQGTNYQYQMPTGQGNNQASNTNNSTLVSTADVSIKLEQAQKLNISSVTTADTSTLGTQTRLSIRYENPGKTDIKNVVAKLTGDILDKEKTLQIGTVKAGSSAFVDQYITPQKAGTLQIGVTLTYEDQSGNTYTTEVKTANITVRDSVISSATPVVASNSPTSSQNVTQPNSARYITNHLWIVILAIGIIIIIAVIVILVITARNKTKKWRKVVK